MVAILSLIWDPFIIAIQYDRQPKPLNNVSHLVHGDAKRFEDAVRRISRTVTIDIWAADAVVRMLVKAARAVTE